MKVIMLFNFLILFFNLFSSLPFVNYANLCCQEINLANKFNDKFKLIPINDTTLLEITIKPKKLKLLHFFGLWCEGQKLGIETILHAYNTINGNIEFLLVLTDIYMPSQLSMISKYFEKKTNKPIYIFNVNQNLSYEDIDQFVNVKPHKIREIVNKLDPTVADNFSLPFTCLIDEQGRVLKTLHPLKVFNEEFMKKNKKNKINEIYEKKLQEFLIQYKFDK